MNTKDSIVHFQFSDSLVFNNDWNEKLKVKMRKSCDKPKHVYIGYASGSITQYEIVYDKKTFKFQDLHYSKCFINRTSSYEFLINKEKNELLSVDRNGHFYAWNLEKQHEFVQTTNASSDPICISWYHDKQKNKKYLILGCNNGKVEIWDWETKNIYKILEAHDSWIEYLLVEGDELLTCGNEGSVGIWCLKTLDMKRRIEANCIKSVCFIDKNKTLFATFSLYGGIKIHNKTTGQCLFKMESGHKHPTGLLFSLNLNVLISFGFEKQIKFWLVKKEKIELDFVIKDFFDYSIVGIQFLDPIEQTQVLVCNRIGNLFIVDLKTKKVIWKMENSKVLDTGHILVQ